jgi:hypothetical protein
MASTNKKLTIKEVKKLLINPDVSKKTEAVKNIQKNITYEKNAKQSDIWVISDDSTNFSSLRLKNG